MENQRERDERVFFMGLSVGWVMALPFGIAVTDLLTNGPIFVVAMGALAVFWIIIPLAIQRLFFRRLYAAMRQADESNKS